MFLFWSHSKSVLLISLVIWTISEWLLIQHTLFFDKHSVFLASQPQHAYCFSYSSLKSCLQYARASLGGGGRSGKKPWFPHFNFRTKQGPKTFQFQASGILLFTGVQKIYRPEISRFFTCMLHFLNNLRRFFIFSNCIREKDDV